MRNSSIRALSGLTILAVLATASLANARAPRKVPNCGLDADGDGYCVPDPSRGMPVDPADPAKGSKPYHKGTLDCNDNDRGVSPAAKEIPYDGIDQDCKGGDLEATNITDKATYQRYAKRRGCNWKSPRCLKLVDYEYDQCDSSPHCTTSDSNGRMRITNPDYMWYNKDCKGGREVISQADRDKLDEEARARGNHTGHRCVSRRRATPRRRTSGVRRGGARPPARPKAPPSASRAALDALRGDLGRTNTRVDTLNGTVTRHETELGRLGTEIRRGNDERVALRGRIAAVEGRLTTLGARITDTDNRTSDALRLARANKGLLDTRLSIAPLIEFTVGLAYLHQGSVNITALDGSDLGNARGNHAPAVTFGVNLGADLGTTRVLARGQISPIWDEGPNGDYENGLLWQAGLEASWARSVLPRHFGGVHFTYIGHEAGGDVLNANAQSHGFLVGPTYTWLVADPDGPFQLPLSVRAGIGHEWYGTKGDGLREETGSSMLYAVTLDLGFGVGSAVKRAAM